MEQLAPMESRFADLIWANAPLSSGELVRLCQQELEWKKSTTYTMLRRLCERGIFQNQNGQVTALLARPEFYARQSAQYVEETYGSLPAFLTAFASRQRLSEREILELQKLIDENGR